MAAVKASPSPSAPRGKRAGRAAPTIYTVAERAGVSHQTVSRYLRGETLRPANREAVERALDDLDFQVNDVAQALASRRARQLGAIMPGVDDWAPQRLLGGAVEAAREAGYLLDVVRIDPLDAGSVDLAIQAMNRGSVGGVVVLSPSDPVLERLDLGRLRVPWVVEAEAEVGEDLEMALQHPAALAVEHLVSLGHRRFFHIGGPASWLTARNRRAAYRAVLHRHGLVSCGETEAEEWSAAAGYAAMARLDEATPTAVVAASDQLALGALRWLWERGVPVPQDVSVTGYDGIPDAAYYTPPLTTVEVDFVQLGRHTVTTLLDPVGSGTRPDSRGGPAARLAVRASTAGVGSGVRVGPEPD